MERTLKAVNGSLNVTVPKQIADVLGWTKGQRVAFETRDHGLYLEAQPSEQRRRIVTVGYENHSPQSLLEALRGANVTALVDVRDLPLSRRQGFSKSALSAFLKEKGISYTHIKELGAPKHIRDPYKRGGLYAKFRADYQAHLAGQTDSLDALKQKADQDRTAIMCVERAYGRCHRGVLAEILAENGFEILHA